MKRLIITLVFLFPLVLIKGQSIEFKYEEKVDLNSDGKIDDIKIKSNNESLDYILTINGKEVKGNLGDDPIDGFIIVDINKRDKYKEIAVHTPGPSDDDIYMLYWYDGSEIIAMNQLSRWPEFKGNGFVYVKGWEGFWAPLDKYVLDSASRKLVRVEQYAYYMK